MASPLISFRALRRLSLSLGGAIASTLLISVSGALAQVFQPGDTGSGVSAIQSQLGIPADGVYGYETEDAVAAFQSRNGLAVDGVAGPETLQALGLDYLGNVGGPTEFSYNTSASAARYGTSAVVRTASGIGVNVRRTPNGESIAGVDDGTRVALTGRQEFAGGRTWAEIVAGGGGWIATDFLVFDGVGGPSDPVYPGGSFMSGPFVVAVPGNSSRDLATVRNYVRGAFVDRSTQGAFINAGGFSDRSRAADLVDDLRDAGVDARLSYRRYR